MLHFHRLSFASSSSLFAALCFFSGCNDDISTPIIVDAAPLVDGSVVGATVPAVTDAAAVGDGAAADSGNDAMAAFVPRNPGTGIAVVNSDYKSTSISLIDAVTGALKKDACITSGTKPPAPGFSLSGDVVLPLSPQVGGALVTIDRSNSALTWIDTATCVPSKQLSVATGFSSNPQDVISISATKAYVTRKKRNEKPTPAADDFDEGNDILVIDPSIPAITKRIALGTYASALEGKDIIAGPGRGILANGKVYVTLASHAPDYKVYGFGRVVIVDPATDAVTGIIELPAAKNCGSITHEAAINALVVACAGVYADGDKKAETSAIFSIDLNVSPPSIKAKVTAVAFAGRAVGLERNIVMITPTKGLVVSLGEFGKTPTDQLWLFDTLAPQAPAVKLGDSVKSFEFGELVFDIERGRLFFGDADKTMPRMRVFTVVGSQLTEGAPLNVNPSSGLPPRGMAWY